MRDWLSGRALPCQGKCREFESRFPLHFFYYGLFFIIWRHSQVVRHGPAKPPPPVQIWVAPPITIRRCGGIGRRKGLKIPRSNIRAGSSPASGTTKIVRNFLAIFFLPLVFYKGFLSYKIFWEIAKFG